MAGITVEALVGLVNDIDTEDPIDWSMLRVDEQMAIELIANNILDQYNTTWKNMPDKDLIMLATITKLIVENFTLNLKLHQ